MAYLIRKRPSNEAITKTVTENEAIRLISCFESIDIDADIFEPDTYYIEEVADGTL